MRNRLGAVLAAVMLAGCGQQYASIQAPVSPNYGPRAYNRTTRSAQEVVARGAETYKALGDFVGEVTTWTAETPGDASSVVYGEANITFKKERRERLEITKATDDPKKVGTVVVYTGGDKAKVLLPKPIPVLGRLFTLKLDDKRLASNRGVRLDQMDVQAMLERLNGKRTQLSPEVKEVTVEGRKCLMVTASGSFKGIDDEVTTEEVAFDVETGLPASDIAYVGKYPVLKLGVRNVRINVGVKDSAFELSTFFAAR